MVESDRGIEVRLDRLARINFFQSVGTGESRAQLYSLLESVIEKTELSDLDLLCIRDLMNHVGETDTAIFLILVLLLQLGREGSLCLEVDPAYLDSKLSRFADSGIRCEITNLCLKKLENWEACGHDLMTRDWIEQDMNKPLVMTRVNGTLLLYLQKNFVSEQVLWSEVERLISAKPTFKSEFNYRSLADLLYTPELCLRISPGGEALHRDSDQVQALIEAWQNPVTIITGGPGTGKTSLLTNLLRGFLRMNIPVDSICLGAPTGRAAQRIVESIQESFRTINAPDELDKLLELIQGETLHRILGARFTGKKFRYHRNNPLLKSVLVIDEASMLDIGLMSRILSAIQEGVTRLIIVGDKNQLPSVETGSVLADLVSYSDRHPDRINKVVLTQTYRSAGAILDWSKEIMKGQGANRLSSASISMDEIISQELSWELSWVPFSGTEVFLRDVLSWAKWYLKGKPVYSNHDSFVQIIRRIRGFDLSSTPEEKSAIGLDILSGLEHIQRNQVLALSRAGTCGVENFNSLMNTFLARELDMQPGSMNLEGTPVMITSNDHSRGIYNGDIGLLIRDILGRLYVAFQTAGKLRIFSLFEIRSWEPAFAITVHKSQGSEYDRILMIFPDQMESPLLVREIVYTGITRAKKKVCIYARREILELAMSTKAVRTSREFFANRIPWKQKEPAPGARF